MPGSPDNRREDSTKMSAEITTTGTSIVYQSPWMTVREDSIVRADGTPGVYSVVEKRDFAVIAAVRAQSVYLVEQYRYPVQGRYWELPQGSWETAVEPAKLAEAELREETGLTAGKMVHAGRLYLAYGYSPQSYDVFFATELRDGENQLDAGEQGLVCQAFPVAEVERMVRDGTIKDATTVAAFGLLRLKGLL
jgi:ADP-ribose pyrophosphatase